MCASAPDAFYQPSGDNFFVQRLWSNAAAAASHAPCQPRDSGDVYFVGVPDAPDRITTMAGSSLGITLHQGVSRSVSVRLASDGPTSGPWQLSAPGKTISATFDPPQGKNGDTVQMTLSSSYGSGPFAFDVVSTLGDVRTAWPVLLQVLP